MPRSKCKRGRSDINNRYTKHGKPNTKRHNRGSVGFIRAKGRKPRYQELVHRCSDCQNLHLVTRDTQQVMYPYSSPANTTVCPITKRDAWMSLVHISLYQAKRSGELI